MASGGRLITSRHLSTPKATALFRRSKVPTESVAPVKVDGKGRATPSRREAQAAAKARAKTPRSRKEQSAAQRSVRAEQTQKMRMAMKTGDERFLPARDKGAVKRFIRDFIDVRFSFIELLLPLLLGTMVLGYSGNATLAQIGNAVMMGAILLVVFDIFRIRWNLRRELGRRFPEAPLKGTTYYAIMRSLQMKFMRMPKAQLKIGQPLPENYR